MDKPLVSIIMPLYNAKAFVGEAIQSVIAQRYQNWELLVVDDESTDGSLELAQTYQNGQIKVYSKNNSGAAATRNFGYKLAKGQFIKFFDADDLMNEDMLEAQVALAMQNPSCIISGKWGRFYDNNLATYNEQPEACWKDMESTKWICSSWHEGKSMTQPGIFLIPRAIIAKAGLWNESLSMVDDLEFFTKTILAAPKVIFCERSILYYRSGNSSSLASQQSRKAIESCFAAISLSVGYLLKKSPSVSAKTSAANVWQSFIYQVYPNHKDLTKQAEAYLKFLPKPTLAFPTSSKSKLFQSIFGWKSLKRLKQFL